MLYYFFSKSLNSKLIKKVLLALAIIYVVRWIRQYIIFGNAGYYTDLQAIEAITVILLSIYYFYEQIRNIDQLFIYAQPKFWVVSAYFIFFAGTFFLLLYISTLSNEEQKTYYYLNYIFMIVRTILLSIGMLMKRDVSIAKNYTIS
jgi:hypothetical protein